ncbi:BgTH12-02416 [Blumeria graminis f. sp. triticale]|uniref:BgTH12-02416 n=1 Tax=Blumeria graminis f. sp. triticale TaxID=1689686 RepID=A0A9W4GE43_BLUGR|nr:BgTH12-02416 [Blumeria graminis f. sp. triticale]
MASSSRAGGKAPSRNLEYDDAATKEYIAWIWETTGAHPSRRRHIDQDQFDNPLSSEPTVGQRAAFLLDRVANYMAYFSGTSESIWSEFRLDFDGWLEEDFTPLACPTLHSITLSKLKDVLHYFTDNAQGELHARYPTVKSEVIETPHISTLRSAEPPKSTFPNTRAPLRNNGDIAIQTHHDDVNDILRTPTNTRTAPIPQGEPQYPPCSQRIQRPLHYLSVAPLFVDQVPIASHLLDPLNPNHLVIPEDNNEPLDSRKIETFSKIWNKEYNFTGAAYNILDNTVRQFQLTCSQIDIAPLQLHAIFRMTLLGAAQKWSLYSLSNSAKFCNMYLILKSHFDTSINHSCYHNDWISITFHSARNDKECLQKDLPGVLDFLLNCLKLCQRALEQLCNDLQNALFQAMQPSVSHFVVDQTNDAPDINYNNRKYNSNCLPRGQNRNNIHRFRNNDYKQSYKSSCCQHSNNEKCYICGKQGHFALDHPQHEQAEHCRKYNDDHRFSRTMKPYPQFLLDFEGLPLESSDTIAHKNAVDNFSEDENSENDLFMSAASFLINESARYRLTDYIPPSLESNSPVPTEQFVLD